MINAIKIFQRLRQQYRLGRPWLIWGIGATFFFLQYVARVAPSVMLPAIAKKFALSFVALGDLAAMFYLGYVIAQIPAGILIDRFGSKALVVIATLLCAVCNVIFASSHHFYWLILSRALLGAASTFAFVAAVKLAVSWFHNKRLATMVGITQAFGMIGAAISVSFMAHLVLRVKWYHVMLIIAALFALLAVLAFFIISNDDHSQAIPKRSLCHQYNLWQHFLVVITNRQSWLNALYAGLLYAPMVVFSEFWGPSFLSHFYHISIKTAASAISFFFIGWAIGSITMGWLSDYLSRRKLLMLLSSLLSLVLMVIILYVRLPLIGLFIILFCFGWVNTGVAIAYTLAAEINPHPLIATSVAFTNMTSILVGAMIQPLVGWVIQWQWLGKTKNTIWPYQINAYQLAMSVLIVCLLISFFISLSIKERR